MLFTPVLEHKFKLDVAAIQFLNALITRGYNAMKSVNVFL